MDPHPPDPPHVTHAHAPHLREPPRPDVEHIHPDVLEEERRRAIENRTLAFQHRGWGMFLLLVGAVPSAYCNYRMLEDIGWFLILPPAFVVLFFGPALILLAELVLVGVFGTISKKLFPVWGRSVNEWLDVSWDFFPKLGVGAGGVAGVLAYFISSLFR
jgi:hypothetical protein